MAEVIHTLTDDQKRSAMGDFLSRTRGRYGDHEMGHGLDDEAIEASNDDDEEIDASNDFLTNMMAAFSNDGNLDAVALSKPVKATNMKPLHEILGLDEKASPGDIEKRMRKMANDMDEMSNSHGNLTKSHADLSGKYKGLEMASNARGMAVAAHGKNLKDAVGMLARHAQDACNSSPADLPAHLQKILGMSGYMSNAADMIGGLASDAPHGEMATTYYPSPAPLTAGSPSNTEEFKTALAMANTRAETFKKAAISSRLDVLIAEKKLVPSVKDAELVKLVAMSNDADVESAFVEFGKRPVLDDATLKGGGHVDTKTAAAANVKISNTDGEIIRQREALIGKIETDEGVSYELATTLARRRNAALFGIGTQTS